MTPLRRHEILSLVSLGPRRWSPEARRRPPASMAGARRQSGALAPTAVAPEAHQASRRVLDAKAGHTN